MNTEEVPGTFSPVGSPGDASLAACWDFIRLVSTHASGKGEMFVVSGSAVT